MGIKIIYAMWIFLCALFLIAAIITCAIENAELSSMFGEASSVCAGVGVVFVLLEMNTVKKQKAITAEITENVIETGHCDNSDGNVGLE